jgi:hypothetical protein
VAVRVVVRNNRLYRGGNGRCSIAGLFTAVHGPLLLTELLILRDPTNDCNGPTVPKIGSWSSRDRRLCDLVSPKLTQENRMRLKFQRQVSGMQFKDLVDRT